MSLEYTIDIQLTELGFPDIFEAAETPVKEAPEPAAASGPPTCNLPEPSPPPPSTDTDGESFFIKEENVEDESRGSDSAVVTAETGVTNGTETRNGQQEKGREAVESDDDSGVSEREEEEEEDEEDDGLLPGMESDGGGEQRCGVCDLALPSMFQLQDHMNLHTGERPYCCAECGKRFSQLVNYHTHLRTHSRPKPLPDNCCRICLKGFDTEDKLRFHQDSEHPEKEFYECDMCKRIFTSRLKCEEHIECHRSAPERHACPKCGLSFAMSRSLARHLQRKCRELSYCCSDCPLVFRSKNALLQHSFTHLGLPAYTCVQCHRHFRLARHYNQHKCEPDSIHCVACLGAFPSQEDFRRHKEDTGCWGHQGARQGDEIRCMECGESFASAEELKRHAGAHQRVLTCYECGKGFRSALLLMSHMGGHAGQRPCLCQKCGLGFPHQQVYESHLKNCGNITLPTKPQKDHQQMSSKSPSTLAEKVCIPRQAPVQKTTSKSPSPLAEKVCIPRLAPAKAARATSSSVTSAVTPTAGASNSPLAAVSDSAEGVWKLCLDKDPPPGVKLVVFVPANSHLASGLSGLSPSPETTTPPGLAFQPPRPGMVLPPAPKPNLGMEPYEATSKPGISLPRGAYKPFDTPLDLVKKTGNRQDRGDVLPLDLSNSAVPFQTLPGSPSAVASPFAPFIKGEKRDAGSSEEPVNGLALVKREPRSPGPELEELDVGPMWASHKLLAWKQEIETVNHKASPHVEETKGVKSEREEGLEDGDGEVGSERTLEEEQESSGGEEVGSEGRGGVAEEEQSEGSDCDQLQPGDREAQHSLQPQQGSDTSNPRAQASPSPPSTPPPSKRGKLASKP